jgi:hypothetical protein
MTFLAQAYGFYKALFWEDGLGGNHFGYAYDSVICLNRMAALLGHPTDASHWNETVGMATVDDMLRSQWDESQSIFGAHSDSVGWVSIAPTGMSMFPRN